MPRLLDICRIDVFYYLHTKGSGHAVVTVDAHWPVHPCALVLQFVHILYMICPVHPCALVLHFAHILYMICPVHPCALVLQFVHILYVICPVHPCALVLHFVHTLYMICPLYPCDLASSECIGWLGQVGFDGSVSVI